MKRISLSLEIRLSKRKLSRRKLGNSLSVFHMDSVKDKNDQRGKLDCKWFTFCLKLCSERHDYALITAPSYAKPKQALTTTKHLLEFNYYDFTCHLRVNKDKLRLINHRWKCKKGQDLRLPPVHSSRKLTNTLIPIPGVSSRYHEGGQRQDWKSRLVTDWLPCSF